MAGEHRHAARVVAEAVGNGFDETAGPLDIGHTNPVERDDEDIQITGRVSTTLSENRFDGTIGPDDLDLFRFVDNADEAWAAIAPPETSD